MADERTRRVEAILGRRLSRRELAAARRVRRQRDSCRGVHRRVFAECDNVAVGRRQRARPPAPRGSASPAASAAAGRPIKIGYVSPKTGPLAPFAEADDYILEGIQHGVRRRDRRTAARPTRSRSSPRTASPTRTGRPRSRASSSRTTRSTSSLVAVDAGDDEPGRRPVRGERRALHLVGRAVAAVVLRSPAGQAPPDAKPFEWTYHFFWGLEDIIAVFLDMWRRSRRTRSSAPCGRTTATATPGAARRSASRRRSRRPATRSSTRVATRTCTTGLHRPDHRLQDRPASRSSPASRSRPTSRPSGRRPRSRASSPRSRRSARRCCSPRRSTRSATSARACRPRSGGRPSHPFSSSLTGASAKELGRRLHDGDVASSGPSRSASPTRCSRSRPTS